MTESRASRLPLERTTSLNVVGEVSENPSRLAGESM